MTFKSLKVTIASLLVISATYAQRPKGFTISVPSGATQSFRIKPESAKKLDGAARLIAFAKEKWYPLPEDIDDCRKHMIKMYEQVPPGVNVYYHTVTYYTQGHRTTGPVNSTCDYIGPGINLVDALSTEMLYPTIKSLNPNPNVVPEHHFVEISRPLTGGEMIIGEVANGGYREVMAAASRLSEEKLKKLAILPSEQLPASERAKVSAFWNNVTLSNTATLAQSYNEIKELNRKFEEAERQFVKGIELYQEYGRINANRAQTFGMINLMLQAASTANTINESNQRQAEADRRQAQTKALNEKISNIEQQQNTLKTELNKLHQQNKVLEKSLNDMNKQHMEFFRRRNIPLNDVPPIPATPFYRGHKIPLG